MSYFGNDINALSLMLSESREACDSISANQSQQPHMSLEPSRVILGGAQTVYSSSSTNSGTISKGTEKDIWQDNEIPTKDSIMRVADDRPSPQYEFSYKQEIGTQDTFLGLNGKTPSSSDCSHLVIKIHFPGSKMSDLDLDVTRDRVKAESARFKLFAYLPVAVNDKAGKATFDSKTELLIVTLPIINELFE